MQDAVLQFVESSSTDPVDESPATTAIREIARLLGDVLWRVYDETDVPLGHITTKRMLRDHMTQFANNELNAVFDGLLGDGGVQIVAAHGSPDLPQ